MADKLFVLRPEFEDKGTMYFCPFSAEVIGFLVYFPQVKSTVELIELDFPRPRHPLFDLLGEAHQSAPMLVLDGDGVDVPGVTRDRANGHTYVTKTTQILRYLAATRGVPGPH